MLYRPRTILRTKLLIYPRFQLGLIALNWSVITLVFGLLAIQSNRIFSEMSPLAGLSGLGAAQGGKVLAYYSGNLSETLLWSYAIAMIASGALTLIASFRFAGPLIRLRSYFEALGKPGAATTELKFRESDLFTDLPPVVNAAVKRLRTEAHDGKGADLRKSA